MSLPAAGHDLGTSEWFRLSALAEKYEPKFRLAYTRAIRSGTQVDELQLRKVIIDALAETCITSANVYSVIFNPNSHIYVNAVDDLLSKYVKSVQSKDAENAVRRILPRGLPLQDRRRRLNVLGLDTKTAVEIERYRQEIGDGPSHLRDVERVRIDAIRRRGNLIALTETNRVINTALESLWLDNLTISKSDVVYFDRSIKGDVIPARAKKEIVTRRDSRVCNYCDPLDGVTARIGEEFDTHYGSFASPPFHPRCRCFMILSLGRTR